MTPLKHKFTIDFSKVVFAENFRFRGNGMVSANNSSRLLIDYKALNPKSYWEILNYIFGEKGINVTHLKIEMGSDINIVDGEEVCTWGIADRMKNDSELCDAVDVIGSHYTSFSSDNAKWLAEK